MRRCLDVFARMLARVALRLRPAHVGLEMELNLVDDVGDPGMRNAPVLDAIADAAFQTEMASVHDRDQHPAAAARGHGRPEARAGDTRQPQRRRGQGPLGRRHIVMIGILPTIRDRDVTGASHQRQPALRGCSTSRSSPRAGRTSQIVDRRRRAPRTTADTIAPEAACTSVQFHHAGESRGVRRLLERRPGDRGHPGGRRRQLAVPLRQGALARDAHRAVRAGHRHPPGGVEGPGRPSPRLVRRAVDHLDLRPVRGERALLPGPAADRRRRRTRSRPSSEGMCPRWPSCGCTTAPCIAGTGRSTTSSAGGRIFASRIASCRRVRRWST